MLLTFPGPVALLVGTMPPMATDGCGPDDCSQALTTALDVILRAMPLGGVLTSGAWLTSWLPPWSTRWTPLRIAAAFLSPAPPLFVVLPVCDLPKG
ncbi:hypothetical protein ACWEQO_09060 [Streptomyces sp. NPDC004051]